jgi:cullin 3
MSGAPKKRGTRIEPFRHRVETDPKFFEKSWRKLHDAIREIYNHNSSGLSFEELYRLNIARKFPSLNFFWIKASHP